MHSETGVANDQANDYRYVAVGVPLGRWFDPEDQHTRAHAMIRRGDEFAILDLEALDVFLPALTPKRPDDLLRAASERRVDDPRALIATLEGQGLLVRFGSDEQENLETLRRLRLQTVGIGLGNDEDDDPETFVIADHKLTPLLTCDRLTYIVWAASDGRSFGEICDELARSYSIPSEVILRHVFHKLPGLLSAGVAFLDSARKRHAHE